MAKKLVTGDGYAQLLSRIRDELTNLELVLKRQTVQTYWRIGRSMAEHLLKNKDRAGYGERLYERLSRDLLIGKRTLECTVQFYRSYRIANAPTQLTWTHFRNLMTVKNEEKRKRLENQAVLKGWSSRELKKHIQAQRSIQTKAYDIVFQLPFTRGQLNTYRIMASEYPPAEKGFGLFIDCGFRIKRPLPATNQGSFKEGDFINVMEGKSPALIHKVSVLADELFTYKAYVKRIVDGDTLLTVIDIGFGNFIEQRLRLYGIDAPEASTPQGQQAKRFVRNKLKNLKFIIIKTYKDRTDKYDRYLADVFYSFHAKDGETVASQGRFLNQELLNERLAVHFLD